MRTIGSVRTGCGIVDVGRVRVGGVLESSEQQTGARDARLEPRYGFFPRFYITNIYYFHKLRATAAVVHHHHHQCHCHLVDHDDNDYMTRQNWSTTSSTCTNATTASTL